LGNRVYFFIIIFALCSGFNQLPDADVWSVGNTHYLFKTANKIGPLISLNCYKGKKNCKALLAFNNRKKINLSEKDIAGGKNPGSVVCKKFYLGKVLILKNSEGLENSFCKFSDNTLISSSDIFY
jgi:hypothetical protein